MPEGLPISSKGFGEGFDATNFRVPTEEELKQREEELKQREEEEKERERKQLGLAIASTRRQRKQETLRNQRAQEIIERDLNSRLLTVDYLEEAILEDEDSDTPPKVAKRTIEYDNPDRDTTEDITIYDLSGIPFAILLHNIDYRSTPYGTPHDVGRGTSQKLHKNPKLWEKRRDEVEFFGGRHPDALSDVISTSYINSEHNLNTRAYTSIDAIYYGFDHVDADSIILIKNADAGSSNVAGLNKTELSERNLDVIDNIERRHANHYNEILLRRYSENGKPKRPSYIVTMNGVITEDMLKHASSFHIPIINIEESIYKEKLQKQLNTILESISESDSYKEIDKKIKISEAKSTQSIVYLISEVGVPPTVQNPSEYTNIELKKRLDFIEDSLKTTIDAIKRGELDSNSRKILNMTSMSIRLHDVENNIEIEVDDWGTKRAAIEDDIYNHWGCSYIELKFCLEGSDSDGPMTRIYDGERSTGTAATPEELNSEDYKRIMPLVKEYLSLRGVL